MDFTLNYKPASSDNTEIQGSEEMHGNLYSNISSENGDAMTRRVIETEYMLNNLDQAVENEAFLSDGSLSTVVERALIYEEDGKLKKRDDIIQNSEYSDELNERTDRLIDQNAESFVSAQEMLEDSKKVIDDFEAKALSSVQMEGYTVDNRDLQAWFTEEYF